MLRTLFSRKQSAGKQLRRSSNPGRFPPEVYQVVFHHLSHSNSDLRTLRLVSFTFRLLVEPFIRITASVNSGSLEDRKKYLHRIVECEGLARLIRSFRFVGTHDDPDFAEDSVCAQEYWELLAAALRRMERLEYLVLIEVSSSWADWQSSNRRPINLLEGTSLSNLKTAYINSSGCREFYLPFFDRLWSAPA